MPSEEPVPPDAPASFEDVWAHADGVEGWLTEAQGRVLWSESAALREGAEVVEIGSHQGRSTIVLAGGVSGRGGRVTAVDPFPPDWRYGGTGTEQLLREHLAAAGLTEAVEVQVRHSQDVLGQWQGRVDLVYVDGKHDYWSARHDLRWGAHLEHGGRLLLHDAFSSLGVTAALLVEAAFGAELVYLRRTGSLAVLERRRPAPRDRVRVLREVPWFARNVVVKVLLRLRLRALARLLRHHGEADPY